MASQTWVHRAVPGPRSHSESVYGPGEPWTGHRVTPQAAARPKESEVGWQGAQLLTSPAPHLPCPGADQHLHDAPVQLRERPPGPVHVQAPGALPALLDQPPAADAAARAAGAEVLPDLLRGEGPALAGGWTGGVVAWVSCRKGGTPPLEAHMPDVGSALTPSQSLLSTDSGAHLLPSMGTLGGSHRHVCTHRPRRRADVHACALARTF